MLRCEYSGCDRFDAPDVVSARTYDNRPKWCAAFDVKHCSVPGSVQIQAKVSRSRKHIQEDRSRAQHAAGSSSPFVLSTCARRTQRRKHATKPFDAASSMNLEKTLRNSKLHESRPPSDVTEHVVCVEAQDYRAWSRIPEKPSLLAFVSSLERASCTYDIALPTCRESQRHPRICMDIFSRVNAVFESPSNTRGSPVIEARCDAVLAVTKFGRSFTDSTRASRLSVALRLIRAPGSWLFDKHPLMVVQGPSSV